MKALITDNVHPVLIEDLESIGVAVTYLPKINQAEVELLIQDYEILVINSKINVDVAFIDKAVNLKCIGRLGSGMEIVDQDYAKLKGIGVFSSPEGNCDAVGEHAIGMLLSLFNKLAQAHQDVVSLDWHREANRGEELKGKTIGLIGYGHTGKATAKKLSGFDVEVIFYDKYIKEGSDAFAKQVSLDEIYRNADVVSFHLPLTAETHYYFDDYFLNLMQKPFYLINTSRGSVVSPNSLEKGIANNKILGACLDVFENEKPETYSSIEIQWIERLQKTKKLIFSTHVAGWTVQSKYKLSKIISERIVTYMQ